MIMAAKVTTLMSTTQPAPRTATSSPAMPGPIRRAPLNEVELRATAFGRSFLPTSSPTKVCRAGASIAVVTPRPRARA